MTEGARGDHFAFLLMPEAGSSVGLTLWEKNLIVAATAMLRAISCSQYQKKKKVHFVIYLSLAHNCK